MVKVEEPKPVETPITEVVTVEPVITEASPPEEQKPKPRRVRKKDVS